MTFRLLRWLNRHISKRFSRHVESTPTIFTNTRPEYARYDVGKWTYGCPTIHTWQSEAKLSIGSYCSIAAGVQIMLGGEHITSWSTTFPFAELMPAAAKSKPIGSSKGNVRIGNDVWIGHDALILSGVTIGDGAVVGAGCVVAKNVEPYAIVAGNPARFIRYRIAENFIPKMLQISWWNWPEEKILRNLSLLQSPNVDQFLLAAASMDPASKSN